MNKAVNDPASPQSTLYRPYRSLLIALVVVVLGVTVMEGGERMGLLTADVEGGQLCLWRGIARMWYYKIGDNHGGTTGENAAKYGAHKWKGRAYMEAHPGDWCVFLFKVDEAKVVSIVSTTEIEITLADGTSVRSLAILTMDSPNEERVWVSGTEGRLGLYLEGNLKAMTYGRSAKRGTFFGAYPLYVQFPAGSCLAEDADGQDRSFKSKPVSVSIHGSSVTDRG